jgi:hypothetical protein
MDTVVHETRTFYQLVNGLCEALDGDDADLLVDHLCGLMETLEAYRWDDTLPITPYHGGRSQHQCPIDAEFILVFKKRVEHDRGGLPVRVHLDLLGVERFNPSQS